MSTTYKIGEAAALLNLKTYVLRFWETEFPDIAPLRTEKGQRLYTDEHLALLERIRYLLHERGLTIGGARKVLEEEKARGVKYVFGMPAALPQPSEWSPDSPRGMSPDTLALLAEDAEKTLANSPQFQKVAEAVAAVLDRAASDAPLPPPRRHGKFGQHKQPSQYNLPGLEALAASRSSVLDSPAGQAYGLEKDDAEALPEAPGMPGEASGTEGMLPLFAVAKAAFLARKAAGGDNFIQAGAVSPAPLSPSGLTSKDFPQATFGRRDGAQAGVRQLATDEAATQTLPGERESRSRSCLRDILAELESLADLLRRREG